ncbi:hypothetical protein [Clostridium sp.]|nr:hypothetical protein [Clostridium sp.]MDR3593822.1 hypothetical protein [Clostridium sp.]
MKDNKDSTSSELIIESKILNIMKNIQLNKTIDTEYILSEYKKIKAN